MLVEDDPSQATLYATILRRAFGASIQLAVFSDPRLAAACLQKHLIEILITDVDMPGLDGIELVRLAKERYRGTQVIVMTAASTTDSLIGATDQGAADYLLKPFAHDLLVELVKQAAARLQRWKLALAATLHDERLGV